MLSASHMHVCSQHIKTTLGSLGAGWELTEDAFVSQTPYGQLPFTNIIANLNSSASRRLVLACHYDSKYYPPQWHGREFQGATDSAAPCAMMLELARTLDEELKAQKVVARSMWLKVATYNNLKGILHITGPSACLCLSVEMPQSLLWAVDRLFIWGRVLVVVVVASTDMRCGRGSHASHTTTTTTPLMALSWGKKV